MQAPHLDPALPGLGAWADREPAALPGGWRRRTARWRPGRDAVLTFRHPPSGEVIRIDVTPDGTERRSPVDDPALPGLATLLARRPGTAIVSYKPESSCVIGADGDTVTKVFPPGLVEPISTAWAALAEVGGVAAIPRIPRVVEVDHDEGILVMTRLAGDALRDHTDAPEPSPGPFHLLGLGLAALNRVEGLPLPEQGLADDVREAETGLDAMEMIDPGLADRVRAVLTRLRSADAASPGRVGPAHGALRTDQVLVGPALALVDLDGACSAPPERDVANLDAYLWWRSIRLPALADELALRRAEVWRGLVEGGAEPDPLRFTWHRAASLLKIATRRYRSLERSEWPLAHHLVAEAERTTAP